MKTLLLNVTYTDPTGKFWADSSLKNTKVSYDPETPLHDRIAEVLEDADYMELSYKNKPRSTMYRDKKNGESIPIGYVYRGKTEIYDRSANINGQRAYFDVWVEISEVANFEIEVVEP